jgi:hypothetical protein
MHNDIVHEGRLSGSKFSGKTKGECASVTADALNLIDQYVLAGILPGLPLMGLRWKPELIENGLPMLSFHV